MLEITDQDFKKEVIEADKPVVVDFFASWCGPCQMLMPKMEELTKRYAGQVKIVKMSVEKNQQTPGKFHIMAVPNTLFFQKGKVIDQITGADPVVIEKKIKGLI